MGLVTAEITLTNPLDVGYAREGYIETEDIRSVTVLSIVDTGAMTLVITEELRRKLGLRIIKDKMSKIANGQRVKSHITDSVEVRWKNRISTVNPVVIPGADLILLGLIPLESMDLIVNPVTQELVGAHGDEEEIMCVGVT